MFSDNNSGKKSRNNEQVSREQNKISQGTKIVGDIVAKGAFRIEGLSLIHI